MRELIGSYRDISIEEIIQYGKLDERYIIILREVYYENKSRIPFDLIAYFTNIISYDRFIREYAKDHGNIIYGDSKKLMSKDLLDYKISGSLKELFKKYNIVPLSYNNELKEFVLLTSDVDYKSNMDNATFSIFISTLKEQYDKKDFKIKVAKGSNKLFCEVLYKVLGEEPYTEEDIDFRDMQKWNMIFTAAIVQEASDVYIDAKKDGISIDFSIYNDRIPYRYLKLEYTPKTVLLNSLTTLGKMKASDFNFSEEPRLNFRIDNLGNQNNEYYGRCQLLNTTNGFSVVVRVSPTTKSAIPIEQLKISNNVKDILKENLMSNTGIVLLGGATGSGKSTTIYSCLDHLKVARSNARIEEISKPVEAEIEGINQISVDEGTPVSIEKMVEAETRRNAQIIFLGEINNDEVARSSVNLALQSKLLISTIHVETAALILERIKGMTLADPDAYNQFIELIRAIVHQIMLKEACPRCSFVQARATLSEQIKRVFEAYEYGSQEVLRQGNDPDCEVCQGRGFLINKPVIVASALEFTDEIRDKIKENPINPKKVLDIILYKEKTTTIHDALKYVANKTITLDMAWYNCGLNRVREDILIKRDKLDI